MWGGLHGLYYFPEMIWRRLRAGNPDNGSPVPVATALRMVVIFFLVCLAWIFFRAPSVADALLIIERILVDTDPIAAIRLAATLKLLILGLLVVEWRQRREPHALRIEGLPTWARWLIYYALVLSILQFGGVSYSPFIYFQF